MGFFRSLRNIFTLDINALLDQAEDIEEAAGQLIREMEEAADQARVAVAGTIAARKSLEDAVSENRRLAGKWNDRAEDAVDAGRDDLAKKALMKRREFVLESDKLVPQVEQAAKTVQVLKENLEFLEDRIEATRQRRDWLVSRGHAAEAQKKIHKILGTIKRAESTADKLDRLERQVKELESQAAAAMELAASRGALEDEFTRLEKETGIDEELSELKRKRTGDT